MNYYWSVSKKLSESGIRCEIDERSEKIGYKIREARNERVPYIVVIGEKEEKEKNISLRSRKNGDEGAVSVDELIMRVIEEVKNKNI